MARHLVVAIAASLALFAAAPVARALPPTDVVPGLDDLPIEPPIDPCDLDPSLCEPPPPPDPCELDPSLPECQPEPPFDPCDVSPIACEPEEPPLDPGPTFPSHHAFTGSARVKGEGFKATEDYAVTLDWSTATFLAVDGEGQNFTGHVAPKGPSGDKYQLYLDDASATLLARFALGRGVEAAGVERSGGGRAIAVLGSSEKLTLRLRADGSATLKIKCEALGGFGAVTFKANLSAPAASDPG
jgi:hypothetical protein